jgi:hypothetical protein
MSLAPTSVNHEAFYQGLVRLVDEHAGKLTAYEMLAVAANLVGKLIAMQDQRKVTPKQALQVVAHNIEYGNAMAMEQLMKTKGSG